MESRRRVGTVHCKRRKAQVEAAAAMLIIQIAKPSPQSSIVGIRATCRAATTCWELSGSSTSWEAWTVLDCHLVQYACISGFCHACNELILTRHVGSQRALSGAYWENCTLSESIAHTYIDDIRIQSPRVQAMRNTYSPQELSR
jgi:hypothetical protein